MSNYYATKTEVIVENLDDDGLSVTVSKTTRIHIGKSFGDWAFRLHIYPKLGIKGEFSMLSLLEESGWEITSDLYGNIDLPTLLASMKLPEAPVRRYSNRVGSSRNCDYTESSFF